VSTSLHDLFPWAFAILVLAGYFFGAIHMILSGRSQLAGTDLPSWKRLKARTGIVMGWILIVWAACVALTAISQILTRK